MEKVEEQRESENSTDQEDDIKSICIWHCYNVNSFSSSFVYIAMTYLCSLDYLKIQFKS